eukprot:6197496-Pleurochrysis_carterae.AAC.1
MEVKKAERSLPSAGAYTDATFRYMPFSVNDRVHAPPLWCERKRVLVSRAYVSLLTKIPVPPILLPRGRGAKKKTKPSLLAKNFMESSPFESRCRFVSCTETKSARSSERVFKFDVHRALFITPPLRFEEIKVKLGPSPGKPSVPSQMRYMYGRAKSRFLQTILNRLDKRMREC